MKRLFITTGLISLVNALAMINGKAEEDVLIILSFSQNERFRETSLKIAGLHKFKKVLFFKKESEIIQNIRLSDYDEIYSTVMSKLFGFLNRHPAWCIFDEGPGYAIADLRKFNNLKKCYVTKFLNKFDLINLPVGCKYLYIDKEKFLEISNKILLLLDEPQKLPTKKNILFIGHYIYRSIGENRALEYYKKYINYFINLEYDVYFKAHPRDVDTLLPELKSYFENKKNFHILNSTLPIEIYDYNFDAAAGSYSGTLVSLPHYRNIPAVNLPMKELYHSDAGLNYKKFFALYDSYIPEFDTLKRYFPESKESIFAEYNKTVTAKPEIKDNKKLRRILDYKPNKAADIFFFLISYCFCFNKKLNRQIRNFSRRDFYRLLDLE